MPGKITLLVKDADGNTVDDKQFKEARDFWFDTQYPAGLYGPGYFVLPGGLTRLRLGHTVTIRVWTEDGWASDRVYHGTVDTLEPINRSGTIEMRVHLIGDWERIMQKRGRYRNWADTRITSDVWEENTAASGAELAALDRKDRLRITPKGVAWTSGNQYVITYQTPTGETVGKVTNSYDMQEGGQQWELALYNGLLDEWSVVASGTGTQDVDLGTANCQLYLEANANQTPAEDGTYYGEVSDVVVYASRDHASGTLGTMNAYEVALDIVDLLGEDETEISDEIHDLDSSLTYPDLVPFISNGYEMYGDQLARACAYGDTSLNSLGFGLRPHWLAVTNRPRLFLEAYPDLSEQEWDYEISIDECDLSLRANLDAVWNYIILEYRDIDGNTVTITPEDDANFKDADSIALYGQREYVLRLSGPSAPSAIARRFLNRHKSPTYSVTQPLSVSRLKARNGGWVQAHNILSGKRLRIPDIPELTGDANRRRRTFLIVRTHYDHNHGTTALSLGGRPDHLGIWMAQLSIGQ